MVHFRINVHFKPGNMREGISALKEIVNYLEKDVKWPKVTILRGFIGVQENYCEVSANFSSLADFETAWNRWGESQKSRTLAERYHKLVESEKIEILVEVD